MTQFRPDGTWIHDAHRPPLAIAHRGASAYAFENTLRAFEVAQELGADMWEVDVRLTADGVPVAFHDADLKNMCGRDLRIGDVTAEALVELTAAAGRPAPLFADIAALAARSGAGIYLDAKEGEAASRAVDILLDNRIARAIVGANTPDYCAELLTAGCAYPVSILVGLGRDPFAIADACGAQIVHPCWERAGDRPDRLLDDAFFTRARERGLPVVTWHEERVDVVEALVKMPILGICSDQPEMVTRYKSEGRRRPEIVCHRGACGIAPENTRSAARAAWAAGFDFVEIDVRETSDGEPVVHHDPLLQRTTSGAGDLAGKTLAQLTPLDAGIWFDPFYRNERVPRLAEILNLAFAAGGKLYVELKQADPVKTARMVLDRMAAEDVFFWSANEDWLQQIRKSFPEARLMARPEDFQTLDACLAAFDADIIEFNRGNANSSDLETVRKAGKKAMVAYMGSDPIEMERLLALDPDLVNVNEPFLLARLLAGKENDGRMDVRRLRA
ncbi:glycerophosphodiester phosphodiesterase family protein [Labrenzia sp. OB1]|uniref:glycerophosphodiester phosphodiesterase n=1 Tax=Labrenzia sp. OB1 TaxID=1561204 RepID=UPI000ADF340E|nr:glycerophosphodiester phosphodiesterase family protein [Labrenzia sp. OB1]